MYICTFIVLLICNVTERMQIPPHIVLDPRNAEVAVGGSVEFSCNATGFPPPDILWLKDGVKVMITENFLNPSMVTAMTIQLSTNPELVVSVLRIEQVDLINAGIYSCLATNNLTNILSDSSLEATLTVQCKFYHTVLYQ